MIETPRLILRGWRAEDVEPFAALNADPEVMRHYERRLTATESRARLDRLNQHLAMHGFGEFAVERREDGVLLGMVGLAILDETSPLFPGVEAGWQLARHAWGKGYATEAARAAMDDGFGRVGLRQIVAFTATTNLPSQGVMARLAMTRREDLDFEHPNLPEGHILRRHLVWSQDAP
jgi:ribosomal-protein-alanine N-acetyltransferase